MNIWDDRPGPYGVVISFMITARLLSFIPHSEHAVKADEKLFLVTVNCYCQ